jgi:hypothetical protein
MLSRSASSSLLLAQKSVNDRRYVLGLGDEKHVAVVDHVQLGAANERRKELGVDERHDRVVRSVHD